MFQGDSLRFNNYKNTPLSIMLKRQRAREKRKKREEKDKRTILFLIIYMNFFIINKHFIS